MKGKSGKRESAFAPAAVETMAGRKASAYAKALRRTGRRAGAESGNWDGGCQKLGAGATSGDVKANGWTKTRELRHSPEQFRRADRFDAEGFA